MNLLRPTFSFLSRCFGISDFFFARFSKFSANDRGFAQGFALCKIPDVRSPEGLRACAKPRSMIRKPVGISYHRFAAWRCGGLRKPKLSVKHLLFKYKTNFKLSPKPAILPNCCWQMPLIF